MGLERAKLIADSGTVNLDFNPETLTIRVTNTVEEPKHTGAEKRQVTGAGSRVLSFEAVFDSTNPRGGGGDVTDRSGKISRMLYPGDAPTQIPERVTFSWGTVAFTGVIEELTETLDYFSAKGMPLRSRLAISIREQELRRNVQGGDKTQPRKKKDEDEGKGKDPKKDPKKKKNKAARSRRRNMDGGNERTHISLSGISLAGGPLGTTLGALGAGINSAASVASQNGLDSLLQIPRSSGLVYDPDATVTPAPRPARGVTGPSLPGLNLSPAQSLSLFDANALQAVGSQVDLSAVAGVQPNQQGAQGGQRPRTPGGQPPWAPAGPTAGSQTAANARVIQRGTATGPTASTLPPIVGSPPTTVHPVRALRSVVFSDRGDDPVRCEPARAPWEDGPAETTPPPRGCSPCRKGDKR